MSENIHTLAFCVAGVMAFLLLPLSVKAGVLQQGTSLRSLSDNWTIYDYQLNGYVPFLPNYNDDVRTIYLQLRYEDYKGNDVAIELPPDSQLFVNNQLSGYNDSSHLLIIDMDSIQAVHKGNVLHVGLHQQFGFSRVPKVDVVSKKSEIVLVEEDNVSINEYEINRKDRGKSRNYLLIISLNIVFIFGVLIFKLSPLNSFLFFSDFVSQLFSYKPIEIKYNTFSVLLFMLYYGFVATFILFFIKDNSDFFNESSFLFYDTSSSFLIEFLQLFSIVMLFVVGKLLLFRIVGLLYGLNTESDLHVFEYIRITEFFLTFFLLFGISINLFSSIIDVGVFVYFIFFALLLKAFIVSIRVSRLISFKKVYLISYFCITEFILVFISVKFFVKI